MIDGGWLDAESAVREIQTAVGPSCHASRATSAFGKSVDVLGASSILLAISGGGIAGEHVRPLRSTRAAITAQF
jgi:hypothetical protein